MEAKTNSLVGSVIRIILKSGVAFNGIVKRWDKEKLVMIAINNTEIIEILDVSQIAAVVYSSKLEKEMPPFEDPPQEEPAVKLEAEPRKAEISVTGDKIKRPRDPQTLIELRQLAAKEDLNSIRAKLKSKTVSTTPVEYGSQFETLRRVKNNTGK